MLEHLASGLDLSTAGRTQLDGLFIDAARVMKNDNQLTPEGFTLARDNFAAFIGALPKGIDDPMPGAVDELQRRTFVLCPLWPFC